MKVIDYFKDFIVPRVTEIVPTPKETHRIEQGMYQKRGTDEEEKAAIQKAVDEHYEKYLAPVVEEVKESFVSSHEIDFNDFSFSCIRHGDFLTLFMSRWISNWYEEPSEEVQHHTTNINLMHVKKIYLEAGSPINLEGEPITFSFQKQNDGRYSIWSGGIISGKIAPGFAKSFEVPPKKDGSTYFNVDSTVSSEHKWPIPAKDDVIRFNDSIAIYVPFGFGASVIDAINEEFDRVHNKAKI